MHLKKPNSPQKNRVFVATPHHHTTYMVLETTLLEIELLLTQLEESFWLVSIPCCIYHTRCALVRSFHSSTARGSALLHTSFVMMGATLSKKTPVIVRGDGAPTKSISTVCCTSGATAVRSR